LNLVPLTRRRLPEFLNAHALFSIEILCEAEAKA
jgi:hypothetical protein